MNNITLIFLIALALVAVGVLFVTNFAAYTPLGLQKQYAAQDVRGMAVVHSDKSYTLNYDQQNKVIGFINQSVPANKEIPSDRTLDFQKIVIYQFEDKPDIVILPVGYDKQGNLLFLMKQKQLRDTSNGNFKQLLLETYDH